MKTAVVILNWNGKGFLEKFLSRISDSLKGYDAELIVADNASTDGSVEYLRSTFPDMRLVLLDRNYGFTGGYNRAFDEIKGWKDSGGNAGFKYFLLLNSDIEVTEDWLYPLEEWMDLHSDCAACAPKLHSYQERNKFEYAGAAGGYLDAFGFPFCKGRVMGLVEEDRGQYDIPSEVLWASGACLMVRSSVWEELGGLEECFFAHMEEIDFCWRARLSGYRVNVVPRSLVYHVGGGTLPQDSPFKLMLNYRNNLLMLSRNYARHEALSLLYDILETDVAQYEMSTDEFSNALEVFHDMTRKVQAMLLAQCAKAALKSARSLIRKRMFIDNLAKAYYFISGKKEYAGAVRRAHREFREMRVEESASDISKYLAKDVAEGAKFARTCLVLDPEASMSEKAVKKCIYDGPIVLEYYGMKESVFEHIKEKL